MVEASDKPIILITGCTGFISGNIVEHFTQRYLDDFRLRLAVRSLAAKKHEAYKKILGDDVYSQLEFVEAELSNKGQIQAACKGVSYIVHAAGTSFGDEDTPEETQIIKERDGQANYLEAAVENKVKRLIAILTFGNAIGLAWKASKKDPTYNDDDYIPADQQALLTSLDKAKVAQESVILDFLKRQEASGSDYKLEIVRLLPGVPIGPTYFFTKGGSPMFLARNMKGEYPKTLNLALPSVDVRDVALAVGNALTAENVAGERIFIVQESLSTPKALLQLHEEFGKYGYKIPTSTVPYALLQVGSIFVASLKQVIPLVDQEIYATNDKSIDLLEMEYNRNLQESYKELGYNIIDLGGVQDLRKK